MTLEELNKDGWRIVEVGYGEAIKGTIFYSFSPDEISKMNGSWTPLKDYEYIQYDGEYGLLKDDSGATYAIRIQVV